MRKIEKAMLAAIDAGKDFHRDNTEVSITDLHGDGRTTICVHLHSWCIAIKRQEELVLSCKGWFTNTTKSRLNAILDHYGLSRIYQRNFVWYRNDKEWLGSERITLEQGQ